MKIKEPLKKIYKFLQKDTWQSLIVTLLIALIVIKFIFFPLLSLATGSSLPLVIVESCSMHHKEAGFEKIFVSKVYEENGISTEDTYNWDFQNGFNKGDVIFVARPNNIEVGDVIIFNAGQAHPIIHRVVNNYNETYSTKGDNFETNNKQLTIEKNISEDQIVGKALFKIPVIGWVKMIFFEPTMSASNRGTCSSQESN